MANLLSSTIESHLYGSHNQSNILLKTAGNAGDGGILLQNSAGAFKFQIYGNGTDYGFLDGAWADWDIRKAINGKLYLNGTTSYYLQTDAHSYLSTLHVADASNGVSLNVGNGSTHGVYTLDNARKYLVVAADYYPHMALVASGSNNTTHGAVFSFVGTEGSSARQWNIGIPNQNPFIFSIGYNRTGDNNPHYGVGDGWHSDDNHHARLSIDRDGNTKIRGMLYVNGTSGGISVGNAVIHAGNIGSQSVSYASSAGNADTVDGYDYSQFTGVLARYGTTAGASSRIRITAPFNTNTGKMFSVDITMYAGYTQYRYTVSSYMYSSINNWYSPKALFSGDGSPDIYVGRDSSGKAYISIANGSYTGVVVNNFVGGYYSTTADSFTPWVITLDSGNENSVGVSVITTITSANIASQSVSYAVTSGTSSATTQTDFSELSIGGLGVATREYVTSQGYLTSLPSHNHDDRYYTESESDGRFQPLENQRLSTDNGPTFTEVYNNGWFRTTGHQGLYNPTNNAHFYPNNASYGSWRIDGTRNGWHGLHFDSGSTLMMNSAETGVHREGAGWQWRWDAGTLHCHKGATGGGVDATVLDTSNFTNWAATSGHTHDLMRYSLRAPDNVDSMTSSNFRTQMFGSASNGWNLSTARWNTVPSGLSGMNSYGTLFAWSGSDTHGFIAADYSTANVQVGGGYGDNITWKATLIHSGNIGSQSVASATDASTLGGFGRGNTTNKIAYFDGDRNLYVNNPETYTGEVRLGAAWGRGGVYASGTLSLSTSAPQIDFVFSNSTRAFFASDGNLWMSWAGTYLSTLLDAKQNASTAINTGNIASQSVNYAASAGSASSSTTAAYLPTLYAGGQQGNPQVYFGQSVGLRVAMTGIPFYWADTLWINGYSGGDVLDMCALHFARNSEPRMWISTQRSTAESYGTTYEVITAWNISSQSVSYAASAGYADSIYWSGNQRLYGGSDGTRNTGWAYHNNNDTGLHWPNNGWHFYPKDVNDMYMRSGSSTNVAIAMNTAGTTRGYVYAENDNTIGFLNNSRSWSFRSYANGNATVYGYLTVNGAGTSSSIYMNDSDEGQREIHCNSNRIGFLTQAGSWGAWLYDSADWEAAGSVRAPIFYDSENTGYYGDFASTSVMNAIRLGTSTNNGTISGGGDWGIRFANDNGWIQFGPANNSWTHIYSDKNFYFNQELYVNGTQVVKNSGTWGISVTGSAASAGRSSSLDIVGYGSGNMTYYQTSGTFAGYSGWAGYFVSNHGDGATYYNQTIIMPFWGPPQYSRLQGGTFVGPYTFWSTENLNDYAPNMNQYVRTTDNVTFNTTTSPTILVNGHSDNTKGYRIHNTSGSSVSAMFTNSSNQLVIAAGAVDQINLNKKVLVNGVALGVNVAPSGTAGRIDASNDIVAYSSSDERLKHNIAPIENALDKVKSLTGVEFDWRPEYKHAHGYEGHDTGIIAQQVQDVMPSAVRTNDTGFLAVRYEKLIGLLIEGMKEQQAQIDELKAKLDGLTK